MLIFISKYYQNSHNVSHRSADFHFSKFVYPLKLHTKENMLNVISHSQLNIAAIINDDDENDNGGNDGDDDEALKKKTHICQVEIN